MKFIRDLCYNRTIATRLHEEIKMTTIEIVLITAIALITIFVGVLICSVVVAL